MSGPEILRTRAALGERVAAWRAGGERVVMVPTLGALHEGHMTLVHRAAEHGERILVSIFVNPTQFAPHEDFTRYPRDEAGDVAMLAATGLPVAVYAPAAEEMYPPGAATRIEPGPLAEPLEGRARPGHFAGVATIVAKLLLQAGPPDAAMFGEKDWQQLQVVRRIVRDLDIATRIIPVATVREVDGLALSSRNRYLSAADRAKAAHLPVILHDVASALSKTGVAPLPVLEEGRARLHEAGFDGVDYLAYCDAETLQPLDAGGAGQPARLLVAARLGTVRLLDNLPVTVDPF